jgi:hypothetical protein
MRRQIIATFIAVLGSWNLAQAKDLKQELAAFDLAGTWSADCSKDLTKEAGSRTTYDVPPSGPVTVTAVQRIPSGLSSERKSEIQDVARTGSDEIRLLEKPVNIKYSDGRTPDPANYKPLQVILQKTGGRLLVTDSRYADGSRIFIENGRVTGTSIVTQPRDRCAN